MQSSHLDTPAMRQYLEIKKHYPDCILFFRMGDFYEMFFEDADFSARVLGLTLTARDKNKEIPMCGVPHHASKQYISQLIALGKKVALCEQIEDPRTTKKLIRRAVTQIITPGTILDEEQLISKQNNYLCVCILTPKLCGLAYLDLSTGEFAATEINSTELMDELLRIQPAELLIEQEVSHSTANSLGLIKNIEKYINIPIGYTAKHVIKHPEEYLRDIFKEFDAKQDISWQKAFSTKTLALRAAAQCVHYARSTQVDGILPLSQLLYYNPFSGLVLDDSTRNNLELFQNNTDKSTKGSVFHLLDQTSTGMGGRLLKSWLKSPLRQKDKIITRQRCIEWLFHRHRFRAQLKNLLKQIYDLERLASRVSLEIASPKDLYKLAETLQILPQIKRLFTEEIKTHPLEELPTLITPTPDQGDDIAGQILSALVHPAPPNTRDPGFLQPDFHPELRRLFNLSKGGKDFILELEQTERQKTGIPSLKILFNRIFGYYIEITKTHAAKVPHHYIRKQTLANAERFTTETLSEYESKVLSAEDEKNRLELELFVSLRKSLLPHMKRLFGIAHFLAHLDALNALSELASNNQYVCPEITDGTELEIEDGRHPVLENLLKMGDFVPNDMFLDTQNQQICLLTGPNMAGKSTIMRQTALICIMAQMGSYVPAKRAKIGLLDRVFTRVGASDNLARGDSTFMVEMRETAYILGHATQRSLVVLDEIGRGTATYDGLSIAWAVVEYLHDHIGCKTLFATHYHELCSIASTKHRTYNASMAIKQVLGQIIFLHKIKQGGANRSYGIEVAKLAGLPQGVTQRAQQILNILEDTNTHHRRIFLNQSEQLGLFSPHLSVEPQKPTLPPMVQTLIDELQSLVCDEITPRQALFVLEQLQEKSLKIKTD